MKKIYFLALLFVTSMAFAQNPGDIIITEIMQNPAAVNDGDGEYFEVHNATGADIDMNMWIVSDAGTNTFTISSSVIVTAGGYAIFGVNGDPGTNGGVTVDYVYASSDMALANGDDEIILSTPGGAVEIDRVEYDGGTVFPDPTGASMNLDPTTLDGTSNDTGTNWCVSTSALSGGDLGTPGGTNDVCGPTCTTTLGADDVTCDTFNPGPADDTYTATLDFSGGDIGTTFAVTSDTGVVSGDNPTSMATGTIIVTGITEGTDVTITVDDTSGGGICLLMRTITSPSCIPTATCPNAGDIIITEIMQNPAAVGDNDGEYFEVFNTTGGDIDMVGWVISDLGSNTFTVMTSVVVSGGSYAVFAANGDSMANGGFTADYVYGSDMALANGDDEVILTCSGNEIDRVEYDGGPAFPDPTGASMELSTTAMNSTDNDDGANWGPGTNVFGTGDTGTPGAANDFTLSIGSVDSIGFNMYPNPNKTGVLNITTSNSSSKVNAQVFDLLGKQVINTTVNDSRLNVTGLNSGLYIVKLTQDNTTVTKKLVIE